MLMKTSYRSTGVQDLEIMILHFLLVFVIVSTVLGSGELGGDDSGSTAPLRFTSAWCHSSERGEYPSLIYDHISGADQHCDSGFEMNYFFSDKAEDNIRMCRENNSILTVSRAIPQKFWQTSELPIFVSCSKSETEILGAEWIAPNGVAIEDDSLICTNTSITYVIPHQTLVTSTDIVQGVYTCRLTVKDGVQVIQHIGVYMKDPGVPVISSLPSVQFQIDVASFELCNGTCTVLIANCSSERAPAYSVVWSVNNKPLLLTTHGNFTQEKILRQGDTSTYDNILKWVPHEQLFSRRLTLGCRVMDSTDNSAFSTISFVIAPPSPSDLVWHASNSALTWSLFQSENDTQMFIEHFEMRLFIQFGAQDTSCTHLARNTLTVTVNTTDFDPSMSDSDSGVMFHFNHTFEDLKDGTSYVVQMRTSNTLTSSNWSEPYEFETATLFSPAGAPENVSTDVVNETAVALSWNNVNCTQRNGEITTYMVQYKEKSMPTYSNSITVLDGNNFSCIITELSPSTKYNFRVAAINKAGIGPYSWTANVTTPTRTDGKMPGPVSHITIIASSSTVMVTLLVTCLCIFTMILSRRWQSHKSNRFHPSTSDELELTEDNDYYLSPIPILEIEDFPEDIVATVGEYVIIYANVVGYPQPTLSWYHNDENIITDHSIEMSDNGTLSIPSMEPRHVGTYRLEASNAHCRCYKELTLTIEEEEKSNLEKSTSLSLSLMNDNAPVPVVSFEQYVESHHSSTNNAFQFQFMCLYSNYSEQQLTIGTTPENKVLNRFKNIIPYDDNRVCLQPTPSCSESSDVELTQDYINASYINGHNIQNKFIATQGPLPHTVTDFWHMVWQEHSLVIVMLCNLVEGHRVRCQQYWPDVGTQTYGPFSVQLVEEFKFADFIIRSFEVYCTTLSEEPRKVKQYQFTSWPDHLTPHDAGPLLALRRRAMLHYNPKKGPIIVHCSAGVGRTGTFIALDRALEQAEMDDVVDIMGIVNSMRQQRMKMVQTLPQYIFIYDSVLEALVCGETQITATNLRVALRRLNRVDETGKTGYEKQYQVLQKITPRPADVNRKVALQCSDMNRSLEYLPSDKGRVVLQGRGCSYIHATFIDGYKHKKSFIITQGPLRDTCNDFWKMAYDYECGAIVMLSGLIEYNQEVCYQYWPDGGCISFGVYSVELMDEIQSDNLVTRLFNLYHKESDKVLQVTQFQVLKWTPDGQCANYTAVVKLLDDVLKVQRKTGNNPIVVHCSDTVSRSAIFCAVMSVIERCKTEGIVDVFQVVKAIRMQKPGAVLSVEQYSFIFDIAIAYLDSMETYSNFKY